MLLQVESEGHQYKVCTEVTDHKRNDCVITKVNGFIKSSNGNLQQNKKTRIWKILSE